MASTKKAIAIISEFSESKTTDRDDVEAAFHYLTEVSEEQGLESNDIDELVGILVDSKLSATICIQILQILIPETTVSTEALGKILAWFFTEVNNERLGKSVQRQALQWLTGIVYYDLGDMDVIQKYYYSLFFMLKENYSESIIGKLLYLLTKPEDAKRWMVKQLLELQLKVGAKAHITSILSILKSYRPDVVPEKVPMMSFDCPKSLYITKLEKAHSRKVSETQKHFSQSDEIKWQICPVDKKSRPLRRLIPSAVSVSFESSVAKKDKLYSVFEFKSMADLGAHPLQTAIPAQAMSLLANSAGFHLIAFSDAITKSRFSYQLSFILNRVFLWELEPYSALEKKNFLNALVGLQEYMHQGIPVVTQFLFRYLLNWDGDEFREEVLDLLTWVTNAPVQDWHDFVFRPLRKIFRSSGRHTKILIIETMGIIIRNLVAVSKREKFFFVCEFENEDYVKTIADIGKFTGELLTEDLLWNSAEGARKMMTVGLRFFDTCHATEQAGDLPIMILMPPVLVYKCLFSNSRLCLSGLCSLLVKYQTGSVQRLHSFGVSDDFSKEISKLHVYMLDTYRCLWSTTKFQSNLPSFIFDDQAWEEMAIKFKNYYQINVQAEVSISLGRAFTDSQTKGVKENIMASLSNDSVMIFKDLLERELLSSM